MLIQGKNNTIIKLKEDGTAIVYQRNLQTQKLQYIKTIPIFKETKKKKNTLSITKIIILYYMIATLSILGRAICTYNKANNCIDKEKINIENVQKTMDSTLNSNSKLTKEEKEAIFDFYEEYIEDYSEYITAKDLAKTIWRLSNLEINYWTGEQFTKEFLTAGEYRPYMNEITVIKDENILNHELCHVFNYNRTEDQEKALYHEIFASITANSGYECTTSIFYLLNELIPTDIMKEALYKNKPNLIWDALEKQYPDDKDTLLCLRATIYDWFYDIYNEDRKEEPNSRYLKEIWQDYKKLYQKKYSQNPEEDIIITYFYIQLMSYHTRIDNINNLDYGDTFVIIPNHLSINTQERHGNLDEVLAFYGLMDPDFIYWWDIKFDKKSIASYIAEKKDLAEEDRLINYIAIYNELTKILKAKDQKLVRTP